MLDRVVSDLKMPNFNGIQLNDGIKVIDQRTKIIFSSALNAAPELGLMLSDVKFHDINTKPVEKKQFVQMVKSSL